ncbi:MAG: hypothetical protein V1859_05465 [archaeon]
MSRKPSGFEKRLIHELDKIQGLRVTPLTFAKSLRDGKLDTSILEEYYANSDMAHMHGVESFFRKLYGLKGMHISDYMHWNLELFREKGFRKNGPRKFVHPLQVAGVLGGYISKAQGIDTDTRMLLYYGSLGHDTIEDAIDNSLFFNIQNLIYRQSGAAHRYSRDLSEILWSLTRLDEEGNELLYHDSVKKISSLKSDRNRSVAFMIKLADRIANTLDFGSLTSYEYDCTPKKEHKKGISPEKRIRNFYKTCVLLDELYLQINSGFLDASLVSAVKSMADDLIAITGDEMDNLRRFYLREAESTGKNLETYFEVSNGQAAYPNDYTLVPGERKVRSYFFRIESELRAYGNWQNYKAGNPLKTDQAIEVGMLKAIALSEPACLQTWVFDEFESHFEGLVSSTETGTLTPACLLAGLCTDMNAIYKRKSLLAEKEFPGTNPRVSWMELLYPGIHSAGVIDASNTAAGRLNGIITSKHLNSQAENILNNLFGYSQLLCLNHRIGKYSSQ